MLKKTITYTNLFTDKEVTEDHFFHISKADLIEMEMSQKGGMQEYIEQIIASEDGASIIAMFKKLLKLSYGKKDGDRFVKSEEAWNAFYSSEAYSQLFSELCMDANKAAEFMNGVVPSGIELEAAQITAAAAAQKTAVVDALDENDPTGMTNPITPRVLTQAEVMEMDSDELKSGIATGRFKLS